jgi:hypothetical protein
MRGARPDWIGHVVASRAQTLEDVAVADMATLAVLAGDVPHPPILEALAESALGAGAAVASCSLAEHGLHDLHDVVGALAASLRLPGVEPGRRNGLVAALDAFASTHKKRSEERFEERAEEEELRGELRALAREYLAAASGKTEARRIHAWLGGRDVTLSTDDVRLLEARTAKRALAQLTRLARVLGARGIRILLRDAEALVDLAPGRRDVAYTVLRELIDNADGGHGGMSGAEVLLLGTGALERRVHSLTDHPALASRIEIVATGSVPVPHQTWIPLAAPEPLAPLPDLPEVRAVEPRRAAMLKGLVRIAQGLPPLEALADLTIGMDAVDARIDQLFEHASNDGSVFALLVGAYGAGKTHHLLHLEARALGDQRPVLRLAVERLDEDLGNPQRHLRRLIESAIVPGKKRVAMLDRLEAWLDRPASRKALHAALRELSEGDGEASRAAARALGATEDDGELDDESVQATLGALDLVDKASSPSYRRDAYSRLHLWLELLARIDHCAGPVLILDEAENLYRAGVSSAQRRTALRSLAYYCGGAIPRATVVLAVTPDTLVSLRDEAGALLDEIADQATILPLEDVAMLRRRLLRARPIPVAKLAKEDLAALAHQARRLAMSVRGKQKDAEWESFLAKALRESDTPRELLRRVAARVERLAWLGARS